MPAAMPVTEPVTEVARSVSWGPLLVACVLVLGVTVYPPALIGADGAVQRRILMVLMWAIIAGLVRGVGFIPRIRVLRWFLSAPACYLACFIALLLKVTADGLISF